MTTDNVIPINPLHKNIAVRLSGGPDSAIIYYVICNFYKDNSHIKIYPYTMASPLRPHAIRKAQDVIDIVARLTSKYPTKHYTMMHYAHNNKNSIDVNSFEYTNGQDLLEQRVISECNLDVIYTGLSYNCPTDEMTAMVENCTTDQALRRIGLTFRDTTRDKPFESNVGNVNGITMHMPFATFNKKTVYQLYQHYNLVDKLYPYTWSCENNNQIDQEDPIHCGVCYFCLERLYAFGKL